MLERGRDIENQWFTKQPLLPEIVILAETASFGRKKCFGTEPKQYSVDHYFYVSPGIRATLV